MHSRQSLPTNKTSATGFIYKPGFVDDESLESLKMAVDKEFSLISNSFYISEESWASKYTSLKDSYDKALALIANLEERVTALENKP